MIITNHAYGRAKKRLGWKKKTLKRMMEKIQNKSLTTASTKGEVRRYLTEAERVYHSTAKLYGDILFVFKDDRLITVYVIPNDLKRHLKYQETEKKRK